MNRPDQIFYRVRIPLTAGPAGSFRDVIRCDRHRPTGLLHESISADTAEQAGGCEICEHDE